MLTGFWVQELLNGDGILIRYNSKGEEVARMVIPKADRNQVAETLLPIGSKIIYPNGRTS